MLELLKFKHAPIKANVNRLKIPVTEISINTDGVEFFNKLYKKLISSDYKNIIQTESKGISINEKNFAPPMWEIRNSCSMLELTVIDIDGMWRLLFKQVTKKENVISGHKAFLKFKSICNLYGIDINKYMRDDGYEFKKAIISPPIEIIRPDMVGLILDGCHHLDINSSFFAGIAKAFPEFKPVVEHIYSNRKKIPIYKEVLNYTQGYMQSEYINYGLAQISKKGIDFNNSMIYNIKEKLEESGRIPLLFNTDGIWYMGDIYHDENEGAALGEWKNDHINCRLRIKTKGAYEFIEDGKYTPVLRGYTNYDKKVPRKDWKWGDIFRDDARPLEYTFIEGKGIIEGEIF